MRPVVRDLLETPGVDLMSGPGIPVLARIQEYFREDKLVLYQGLSYINIMFERQLLSAKRLNILYDDVERRYRMFTNLKGAPERRYVSKACNKSCRRDVTHVCDQTVATERRMPLARWKVFEYHARNAIDSLEIRRVSINTRNVRRTKEPYVRVSVVAARVELSSRAKITNVIFDSVRSVTRTEMQATCAK